MDVPIGVPRHRSEEGRDRGGAMPSGVQIIFDQPNRAGVGRDDVCYWSAAMPSLAKMNDTSTPAERWAGYRPPPLPGSAAIRSAIEKARQLTPAEVLEISVAAGIHNRDGSLRPFFKPRP